VDWQQLRYSMAVTGCDYSGYLAWGKQRAYSAAMIIWEDDFTAAPRPGFFWVMFPLQ